MPTKFDITQHHLVPKHIKLGDKEKAELFAKYHVSETGLPRIRLKDPAIAGLKAKEGDIIKILRKNQNIGEVIFYRCAVNA